MKKGIAYWIVSMMVLPIISWAATINGTVTGGTAGVATTSFVSNATVTLVSGAGSSATVVGTTTTDGTGNYSFTGVPLGFVQVVVNAEGFTPNPASSVFAVNSDTTSITADFSLTTAGSQAMAGTSSIGGKITGVTGSSEGIQVTLRRRATANSAYFVVDSTLTDAYGAYLFSNIASAGPTSDINSYSLTVSTGGYNSFTSGNIPVAENTYVISNITLTPSALFQAFSGKAQNLRFSRLNGQLALELEASTSVRMVEVVGLNGVVQRRLSVPANESRVSLPMAYAPEKGYLFRLK